MSTNGTTEGRFIGDNGASKILLTESSIRIISKDRALSPLGVVTIIPTIQVQLGRKMTEFMECLKLIRKPLATQKIMSKGHQATYKIIRLSTGKVPSVALCTISTIDDTIMSVTFNQELNYNENYTRYEKLSVIHKLTAGKADEPGLLSKAVEAVSIITGKSPLFFKIKQFGNNIAVHTEIKGAKYQYKYTFSKDSRDYYNLLSVGFMLSK